MRRINLAATFYAKMASILILFSVFSLVSAFQCHSQEAETDTIQNNAFNLAVKHTGVSFGNSANFNGVRINAVDKGVETINGINLTLWKPEPAYNPYAVNNGVSIGLVSAYATKMNGMALGTVVMSGKMNGMTLGILGGATEDNMNGFAFGGLGFGSGGNLNGVTIGGIGGGAAGNINGIAIGGLGFGAAENVNGLIIGGLGAGSGKNLNGIGLGTLGVGSGENATGFFIGGLGVGCGGTLKGISIGGLGVGAGESFQGIGVSLGMMQTPELKGLAVSSYVNVDKAFGVTIGLFNKVKELHGIQLGLINYAGNNPKFLRVIPVINMHL